MRELGQGPYCGGSFPCTLYISVRHFCILLHQSLLHCIYIGVYACLCSWRKPYSLVAEFYSPGLGPHVGGPDTYCVHIPVCSWLGISQVLCGLGYNYLWVPQTLWVFVMILKSFDRIGHARKADQQLSNCRALHFKTCLGAGCYFTVVVHSLITLAARMSLVFCFVFFELLDCHWKFPVEVWRLDDKASQPVQRVSEKKDS